jgi:hypothetical protein
MVFCVMAWVWLLGVASAAPINIGNFVWDDRDGDGMQDAGEPGLPGIVVQLWNSTKTSLLASAVTNQNGSYTLTAAGPGSYRVRVVLPSSGDAISPLDSVGTTNLLDSDFNPTGTNFGFTDVLTLADNVISITSVDCGLVLQMYPGHTIGNRVFLALPDGTQPDVAANTPFTATVELLDGTGTVLQTTTTTRLGLNRSYYGFNAPPGTYRLRFIPDGAYIPTPFVNTGDDDTIDSDINGEGLTGTFSLSGSQRRADLDAGFVHPINVGNFVWDDHDGDGQQDDGEPGLGGITVQLWNAAKSRLWASAVTNGSGNYTLQAPGPGDYRVRVVLPGPGDAISPQDQAGGDNLDDSDFYPSGVNLGFTDTLNFGSNLISITSVDCGLLLQMLPGHTIGNRVFRAQSDGTQPDLVPSSLGATVELLDVNGVVLQSTVTRRLGLISGYYSFNAPPGTYRLRFINMDGYIPSPFQNAGGDDTLDSDIDTNGLTALFTLAPDQILRDLDAGFVYPVTFVSLVWHDKDEDGVQSGGELGVPGVVVELWNADKTWRWGATETDANGISRLTGPGAGDYRVWVLRPLATDIFSPQNTGIDDLKDSDIVTSGSHYGYTDVVNITSNVISISSVDAGLQFSTIGRSIPPLKITAFNRSAPSLTFSGPTGGTYQLEISTGLGLWTPTGAPFVGTGSQTVDLNPLHILLPQRYWRVRRTH